MTTLTTLLASGLKPAFEGIKTVAKPIIDFFKGFGSESGKTSATAQRFQGALQAIKDIFNEILPVIRDTGRQVGALLGPAFKSIGDIIAKQVIPAFKVFLPAITPIVKFIYKAFGVTIVSVLNVLVGVFKGIFKAIAGILNVFAGLFTGDWKRVWKGVKEIFGGIWEAIKGLFKAAVNSIKGAFSLIGPALLGLGKTALRLLFTAFKAGLDLVLDLFIKLPLTILKALASLPGKLVSFGGDLIGGFIEGIKSKAGELITAIKETITDRLPGFVKSALGIASPSKVFIEIGKNVGLGFIKGVQGTSDKIKDTFAKLAESVKKTGSKQLIKTVANAQKKILDLANKRDVLRDRYAEAKANLKDLKQEAADYVRSVRDSVIATGNFSSSRSFSSIVRNLTASVTKAKAFNEVITQLKRSGLNDTALTQLVEAGPAAGLQAAQALLSSGDLGIKTVNELQAQLKAQGTQIGESISGAIYNASIKDAEGAVGKIGKDLLKVEDQIVSVAAKLAKELSKIGKIDAPNWLKNLIDVTRNTAPRAQGAPKSPNSGNNGRNGGKGDERQFGRTVVVNNYNPVAEKTSVTVSNTLTRLALFGG